MKVKEFQRAIKKEGIDIALFFNLDSMEGNPNLFYFSGYTGVGALVIPKNSPSFLLVPRMEYERAKKESGMNVASIEKKKLFDYVRANPKVGGHIIRKATKINFLSIFNSTQELFEAAGIEYPRKEFRQLITREAGEKRKKILELLRGNPLMSLEEIGENFSHRVAGRNLFQLFIDIDKEFKLHKRRRGTIYIKFIVIMMLSLIFWIVSFDSFNL